MKILLVIFLLLPFAAHATDADDASLAQVRAAIAMQQAANAIQAAMAAMPKATPPTPVAAPVAAPIAPQMVSIPSEVRDSLVSLASILIPGFIGIGLAWMRKHLNIMQDAAMNDTITKSANGFGALLVQAVQQRGGSLAMLNVHSPEVASLANSLVSEHPPFTAALGMNSEKAASVILKEAAKFAAVPSVTDVVIAPEPKPITVAPTPQTAPPQSDPVPSVVAARAVAPSWPTTPPAPAKAT